MSGYDCLNKKRFSSRRKVDSELGTTTSVGSVFQMCGAATANARLATVDSLMGGTTRWLALLVHRTISRGGRAFPVAGPTIQHSLLENVISDS